jgi:hypothetical protein
MSMNAKEAARFFRHTIRVHYIRITANVECTFSFLSLKNRSAKSPNFLWHAKVISLKQLMILIRMSRMISVSSHMTLTLLRIARIPSSMIRCNLRHSVSEEAFEEAGHRLRQANGIFPFNSRRYSLGG